ncbi:hypothetical protein OROMI_005030 [Orobanche minor]
MILIFYSYGDIFLVQCFDSGSANRNCVSGGTIFVVGSKLTYLTRDQPLLLSAIMSGFFRKQQRKQHRTNANPNLQDAINSLRVPPHQRPVYLGDAPQLAHGDTGDEIDVDAAAAPGPSSSDSLELIIPIMSSDPLVPMGATIAAAQQHKGSNWISSTAFDERNVTTLGPWGGQGGREWEWDGTIQRIFVNHGTVVYSLTFQSIENGAIVWSEKFGGGDGDDGELCEISIEDPEEYLVAVRGTTGIFRYQTPVITSITFVSNKRTYGPFGEDAANQFSLPMHGNKIIGFYGRCDGLLDAVGVRLVPLALPKPIPRLCSDSDTGKILKIGPWGGQGGSTWEWDHPVHKIIVRSGIVIHSLTFGFMKNGVTIWSRKFGVDDGAETKISIDEPGEYLVAIRATTDRVLIPPIVTSLTFISNKHSYGPFGRDTGEMSCIPTHRWKIVSLFGRCGLYLDAIGFNLGAIQNGQSTVNTLHNVKKTVNSLHGVQNTVNTLHNTQNTVNIKGNITKLGPWGRHGVRTWEWDGSIQKIFVNHGSVVYSLTFQSIENGTISWSETFGGGHGNDGELCEISLEDPEEYFVALRGTTGMFGSETSVIASLSFISNKRSYGPFGKNTTDLFSIPMHEGKIVGFYGECGGVLNAIGYSLVSLGLPTPIPRICEDNEMENILKLGPWGGLGGSPFEWDRPIHKIKLRHGIVVDSITFGSMKNGVTTWSKRFGGNGGTETKISIEEPGEYLVAIGATTSLAIGNVQTPLVTSLTFISNKCSYGPFGRVTGNQFCIPKHRRKVVSFCGRAGQFLDAIGFNLGPVDLP